MPDPMPLPPKLKSNTTHPLVRWIQVITLGCSLGLFTVFVVLNIRMHFQRMREDLSVQEERMTHDARFVVSTKPTGDELSRLVEKQLTAFRKNDYSHAYELAAGELKSQISLPMFERMVRVQYPVIAKSTGASFGVIVDNGEQAIVNVDVHGEDGMVGHYQYMLHREQQSWKIRGVAELKRESSPI